MSIDAGGLAQMTFNAHANGGFGTPSSGYGSRGKGAHMKRLSVAPSPNINSIYEDEVDGVQVPRTSRSHLLAGLRTAPRASTVPSSAPYNQQRFGHEAPAFAGRSARFGQDVPQTATTARFPSNGHGNYQNMYCLPEQILAPPELGLGMDEERMDPETYSRLMSQNMYLLQRQQALQQQLMNITAAAQQFQGLSIGHHAPATPITPQMSMYNQQLQNGVQPIVQPIPNQPGVYTVYNPLTGQHTIFYDQGHVSPPIATPGLSPSSPPLEHSQRERVSSPFGQFVQRTNSPPKASSPPQADVTPLPPPSANAYRPGHRKSTSNANTVRPLTLDNRLVDRPAGIPRTPMTGTFEPGRCRAGEHPSRQPRGPPPLDELVAAPTSKHEGSKNFAARQRRRAVYDLVRAGKERSGRSGSSDLGTPSSEGEISFVISSDAESEGSSATGSGSLAGDPTFGNFKAASAIGSERKQKGSLDVNSPRPFGMTRDFAAAVRSEEAAPVVHERRKSPLLVLASAAEKRKGGLR